MAFSQRGGPDINVTPLIDVLLVLLVIFMIVIPKTVKIEELEVPPADAGDPMPVLVVTVKADLSVVVTDDDQDFELSASELTVGLRQHMRDNTHVVFVEFEDAVLWDQVVATVDTVKAVAPTAQVALKVRD
jgi:biopolymer transport protein ExbD